MYDIIEYTCKVCGNVYTVTAVPTPPICLACRRAYNRTKVAQNAAVIVQQYGLPQITGVSAELITKAEQLRNRYITKNLVKIQYIRNDVLSNPEKWQRIADRRYNGDVNTAVADGMKNRGYFTAYKLYTISDAASIILLLSANY